MASASDEETHAWLRAHGAELPVDMRPESVAFLRRLAAASTHRDRTERQLALDAERRCAMHAAELEKLEDVLQQCGIAPKSLPTSITGSLENLSSSAIALGTRDATLSSLYGAFDSLEVEEAETRGAIGSEEQLCSSLHSRLAECNSLLQNLRDIELACKEQAQREAREQAGRKQDMTTLEKKSIQYKQDIKRVKEELKRNGVGDKIYHSKILQESQTVLALHAFLVPLRSSLEAYQGLPSDLRLAKQEVKEARQKLDKMDAELQLSIRNLVVGGP